MRALLVALALMGCAAAPEDRAALRRAAIVYLESLRAAGVDVPSLSPERQALVLAHCGLAAAVVTVYSPAVPEAPAELMAWCADVAGALAPVGGHAG